jgi:hypothetical protein
LALSAAPARAQSAADLFRVYEPCLFQDRDPYCANSLLKDPAQQETVRAADADRAARLVERAAGLKDFEDMLVAHIQPAPLNEALRARLTDDDTNPEAPKGLGFGAHPETLLAWRAKYFDYVPADAVAAALWEWGTLTPEQKDWLSASPRSFDAAKWEALAFARRDAHLYDWAKELYIKMMSSSPKTSADVDALRNTRFKIWQVMNGDQKRLSGEFLTKASAAVQGLQQLDKLPKSVLASPDPAVKALLAKARSGASPAETLAALAQLFDKAAVHNDAVATQAPDRPDQKFSSLDPKLLGEMLGAGLRAEIRDVDAGAGVDRFFENHPLNIRIRELGTNLAQFDGAGAIVFNERFVTDWIKSQGLAAQAVMSDPAKLHELVMILAPVFVHEATHQIQKAWADDHGIFAWNAQHQEIEAKEIQSDYVLEKEAKSPAYRAFLSRSINQSLYVQQDVSQAEKFRRDPRTFRALVMSDYYAGLPSLEATAATQLQFHALAIDLMRAEKKRRAALPQAQRDAIESGGFDKDKDFPTVREWVAYLARMKTSALDKQIAVHVADRDKTMRTYELTSGRESRVLDRIESDANSVIRGDAQAPAHLVPPPPGAPR